MSAEQQLWEGRPSLKTLTWDGAGTLLFSVALALAVYLAYQPALHAVSGLSIPERRRSLGAVARRARLR